MKRHMVDAEYAPYVAQPAMAIVGAWIVKGRLSGIYPILTFQGTQRECEVVRDALNKLAAEKRDGLHV